MSAKLLYSLSDEKPNLNKEFGCMNGIFQVFYRQHCPARPVAASGHVDNSLPSGERRDIVGQMNMESDKEMERSSIKKKKEKHRVSSESSSRLSFSSSQRSSSFSSAEVSTTASQLDQSGENMIRQQHNSGLMMMPCNLKELVKGSINREVRTRSEEEAFTQMGSKFKETPRLSLDSRANSFRSPRADVTRSSCTEGPMSHRRSTSSVVAKLMGLEIMEDNSVTEQRRENLFCDSPRPMSRVEPLALQRSRSVGSIKKIPASKFPLEPAPWKQLKGGEAAVTVYGEIQKRLTQLEFKKSGKDLRALKQILDAMEKTQQLIDESKDDSTMNTTMQRTHQPVQATTSPARNFKPEFTPKVKPLTRKVTSGKQNATELTPRSGLYKGHLDSRKSNSPKTLRSRQALAADSCSGRSQQQSISPRAQPRKPGGIEKQSRPTTPKSEPGKKQITRQQTDAMSPRRKQGIKPRSTLQQPNDRSSDTSNDLRSLRSDTSISSGSNVDIEVTSRHRLEKNCDFPEQHTPKQRSLEFGIKQERPSLKPLKISTEQPSPVSVLDAAFDEEESPSPVKKISLSFKGEAHFFDSFTTEEGALHSEESEWINKPTSFCRSITYDLECFPEEGADFKSRDKKYISEILLASGLLRDLEYSMISFQLNQARLPINPGLFFILEQNKASTKRRGRGCPTEKIRRKLVFDTLNEILAQRFTAEDCTKPHLTTNPLKKLEKISKEEKLLQTVCSEIDRLQQNNSKCLLENIEEGIIWEDLKNQGLNSKEIERETPGIVLDIERMIFRDLVNEVCLNSFLKRPKGRERDQASYVFFFLFKRI